MPCGARPGWAQAARTRSSAGGPARRSRASRRRSPTRPAVRSGSPRRRGSRAPPSLPLAEVPLFGPLAIPAGREDEGPPDGLTLDQAIERLVRENLALRARALEIPQAEADILTASLRANPLIYADSQLIPYGNYSDATARRPAPVRRQHHLPARRDPQAAGADARRRAGRSACSRRSIRTPSGSRSTTSTRPTPTSSGRARRSGSPRRPARGSAILLDRTRRMYESGSADDRRRQPDRGALRGGRGRADGRPGSAAGDQAEPGRPPQHARARRPRRSRSAGSIRDVFPPPPPVDELIRIGPRLPARRRRVPAGRQPRRGRGQARQGQPAVRRLPALPALHLPEQRPVRQAERRLLGAGRDGPAAALQPQPGEHPAGQGQRRPVAGRAGRARAAGGQRGPAGGAASTR